MHYLKHPHCFYNLDMNVNLLFRKQVTAFQLLNRVVENYIGQFAINQANARFSCSLSLCAHDLHSSLPVMACYYQCYRLPQLHLLFHLQHQAQQCCLGMIGDVLSQLHDFGQVLTYHPFHMSLLVAQELADSWSCLSLVDSHDIDQRYLRWHLVLLC